MLAGGLLASAGMILASFATRLLELYLTAGVLTGEGPLVSSPLVWGSGVLAARSALGFPMWDSLRSPSAGFLDLLGSRAWPLPPAGAREGLPGDPGTAPPRPQAWAWPSTSSRRSSCWGCTSSGGGLWPTGWRRRAAPCSCPRCRRSASSCWSASAGAAASCCSAGSCCTAAPAGCHEAAARAGPATAEGQRRRPRGGRSGRGGGGRRGAAVERGNPRTRPRRRLLDLAVCTDRAFAVYAVTKFLMALGLFVPAILLVNYAKDAGVPDTDAAFLLSIVGFVDIVARPACGALAGLARLRPHVPYLFSLALLANGLTDLSSARARSYGALVAFCIAFGLSYGMVGALQFEVLMAAVGAPRFPSALGLVLLLEAVAVLIGPPSAGRLVDALKNYEIIFYLAGSEVALAGVFMAVATNCCLRCAKAAPAGPGTEGGASDTEDAEAEGDSEPLPVVAEEPGNLEALEVLSAQGEPTEPETEARPRLAAESV
uniref:Solute carrier family 16 member 8 n=1 Tax=Macaca fascicularis TaxID=9541 RepID=A0A7N9I9G7_MACFA